MEWITGSPTKAGWYLAAVRTNDFQETYYVVQLWFNPHSANRWYYGCHPALGQQTEEFKSIPFKNRGKIRYHMSMPAGPEGGREER